MTDLCFLQSFTLVSFSGANDCTPSNLRPCWISRTDTCVKASEEAPREWPFVDTDPYDHVSDSEHIIRHAAHRVRTVATGLHCAFYWPH